MRLRRIPAIALLLAFFVMMTGFSLGLSAEDKLAVSDKAVVVNLVRNGDFENWTAGTPEFWETYGEAALRAEQVLTKNGSSSLRVETSTYIDQGVSQPIDVSSDADALVFSGYLYLQNRSLNEQPSMWLDSDPNRTMIIFCLENETVWPGNSTTKTHKLVIEENRWQHILIDLLSYYRQDWGNIAGSPKIRLNSCGIMVIVWDQVSIVSEKFAESEIVLDQISPMTHTESLLITVLLLSSILFISQIPLCILRKSDILNGCDFVEKFTYSLLVGIGLLTVCLEFSSAIGVDVKTMSIGLTALGIASFFLLNRRTISHLKEIGQKRASGFKTDLRNPHALGYMLLLILFGLSFFSASSVIAGSYGSTNDDAGFHSTVIKSYLVTGRIGDRPKPFYDFIIRYPRVPFIIGTYAASMFMIPAERVVAILTVVVFVAISLALYTSGKTVFGKQGVGILVLLFALFSWNFLAPVSWGGLPHMVGLFSLTAGIGFTWRFFSKRIGVQDAILFALGLGAIVNSYPVAAFVTLFWIAICFVWSLFRDADDSGKNRVGVPLSKRAVLSLLAVGLVICLSLPFLLTLNSELNSWIANPQTGSFPEPITTPRQSIEENQMAISSVQFNIINPIELSLFSTWHGYLFFFSGLAPIAWLTLQILDKQSFRSHRMKAVPKPDGLPPLGDFGVSVLLTYVLLCSSLLVIAGGNLTFVRGYPVRDLVPPIRIFHSLYILFSFVSASVVYGIVYALVVSAKPSAKTEKTEDSWLPSIPAPKRILSSLRKPRFSIGIVLLMFLVVHSLISTVCLFSVENVVAPVVFPSRLRDTFIHYNKVSRSDISLMRWMSANLNQSSVVFVNCWDGGQYMNVVSGLRAVYSVSPLYTTSRYASMVYEIAKDPSNASAIRFLVETYSVSYIFIGSRGTEPRFDPHMMTASPLLELVLKVENSYLFRVKT